MRCNLDSSHISIQLVTEPPTRRTVSPFPCANHFPCHTANSFPHRPAACPRDPGITISEIFVSGSRGQAAGRRSVEVAGRRGVEAAERRSAEAAERRSAEAAGRRGVEAAERRSVEAAGPRVERVPFHLRQPKGFTLLEILIALFIFTIISIILTSALHNAISTQSETEKRSAQLTQIEIAFLLMSRDIEQTINRPITNASNGIDGFIGTPQAITFTHAGLANPFGLLTRSTLQRTSYQFSHGDLWRITWPVLDQTASTPKDQRKILSGITEFQFDYLDDQGHFQSSWPPPPVGNKAPSPLPYAVRVTLNVQNWGKISQLYAIVGQPLA